MKIEPRLLIVEDEFEVAEMLNLFFAEQGYKTLHAYSGQKALARCQEFMPHLILMDITLPDMDGYEITRLLRQRPRTAHIPVIFLTKRGRRHDRLAGLELGADDYITKPFDIDELFLRVRNAINRSMRDALTDPLTGLPGLSVVRCQVARARAEPKRTFVEVKLSHADAFRDVYGPLALNDVHKHLSRVIRRAVRDCGDLKWDFIGALQKDHFIVITRPRTAPKIAKRIAQNFNRTADKHHTRADRERGYLLVETGNAAYHVPFVKAVCRLYEGEAKFAAFPEFIAEYPAKNEAHAGRMAHAN